MFPVVCRGLGVAPATVGVLPVAVEDNWRVGESGSKPGTCIVSQPCATTVRRPPGALVHHPVGMTDCNLPCALESRQPCTLENWLAVRIRELSFFDTRRALDCVSVGVFRARQAF
ncbi:hypothetical protein PMIN06_002545 [Paraphaeosphaeria minitans]